MLNTPASNSRICHYCSKEKTWIFSGKKQKDGTKIYTNERKLRWAGRRCPDCERARVQSTLRWDRFERELIENKLLQSGYEIVKNTLPIEVKKDDKLYKVGIRHAALENDQLILEPVDESKDLHILVFASIRICSREQISQIESTAILKDMTNIKNNPNFPQPLNA